MAIRVVEPRQEPRQVIPAGLPPGADEAAGLEPGVSEAELVAEADEEQEREVTRPSRRARRLVTKVGVRDPIIPEDAVVVESDAQGDPTILESGGERFFTPESTPYKQGFRTLAEFLKAQQVNAKFGVHEGSLVPDDSVILTDNSGNPIARFTSQQIAQGEVDLQDRFEAGQIVQPVEGAGDETVFLEPSEIKRLNAATGQEKFEIAQELGIIPEGAKFIDTGDEGLKFIPDFAAGVQTRLETRAAISATAIFREANTQLPDGQFMSNSDLAEIKAETPELHNTLVTQGFDAYVRQINEINSKGDLSLEEAGEAIRSNTSIREAKVQDPDNALERWWWGITPWHEEIGETVASETREVFREAGKKLGINPETIAAAEAQLMDDPYFGEGEARSLTADEALSILFPTLKSNVEADAPRATPKETWELALASLKADVELGTTGVAASTAILGPKLRRGITQAAEGKPEVVRQTMLFGGGVVLGIGEAAAYQAIIGGELVKATWAPDKVERVKDVGTGIGRFFVSIPPSIAAQPALFSGELVGLFVIGPERAIKIARSAKTFVSPHFIPERGMGIEYSVIKMPVKGTKPGAIITATNKALAETIRTGEATIEVGGSNIKLKIRNTPVSEIVGPGLYHATPRLEALLEKGQVKGTLFTSPQLAKRFLDSSATGVPLERPAILLIYPRKGNPSWQPTYNLFQGTKEFEAIYPPGTTLQRVTNLRSRILGQGVGEFVTVRDGQPVPIFRFAEPGATVPKFGLAELAAVRIRTFQATLADIVKGRKGYELIEAERVDVISRRIDKRARELIERGEKPEAAIKEASRAELERILSRNPNMLETVYRSNPQLFEERYLANLNETLVEASARVPRERYQAITPREITVPRGRPREEVREEVRAVPEEIREERLEEDIVREEEIVPEEEIREAPEERLEEDIVREEEIVPEEEIREAPEERLEEDIVREEEIVPEEEIREAPEERLEEEIVPEEEIREAPEEKPREELPVEPEVPTKPVKIKRPDAEKKEDKVPEELREGATTFKQGFGWWTLLTDGTSMFTLERPKWAEVVTRDTTPANTVQARTVRGERRIETADMGIQDIEITRPSTRPGKLGAIRFTRDPGQKTKRDRKLGGNGLRSVKDGEFFKTKVRKGKRTLISRRRLG